MESPGTPLGLTRGRARLVGQLAAAGLTPDLIDAILAHHALMRYRKGARLFAPGAPVDALLIVLGGFVKLYSAGRTGAPVLLTLAGPGDIIGHADFAVARDDRTQLFEAVALSGATVTREHLLRVARGLDAATLAALGERVNALWVAALHRCAQFLGMPLRARLGAVLADLARRFGVPDARGAMVPAGLSQADLAAMIGGSRPMVSKLLQALLREGALARQGRQYIVRRIAPPPAAGGRQRVAEFPAGKLKRSTLYPGGGGGEAAEA